jgi:hypothetical protein
MKTNYNKSSGNSNTIESSALKAPSDSTGFAGSAGSPAETEESSAAMASSVTRHTQNPLPAENFQFLLCGIDSLDLGLFVKWEANWTKICADLDDKKLTAQNSKTVIDTTDIGREFMHLSSGKPPNYRFHLQFLEYHLYIAISKDYGSSPNVYVSFNAAALWHVKLPGLLELLEFDLDHFGGTIERIQPSRVDLCADFRLDGALTLPFLESHRIAKSRKTETHMEGNTLETYYSGTPGAPLRLRIYDKSKEIIKSNKQWFGAIWNTDDLTNIWRVEFQIRRSILHQYRISDLAGLWDTIGSVWCYLTSEWFSLRLQDNDKAERRTVLPWWQAVQECGSLFGDDNGARRTFDSDDVQSIKEILPHVFGRMITIAALSGVKDRIKSIHHMAKLLFDTTNDAKFNEKYQEKLIKMGYRGKLGGSDDEE